MLMETKRLVLRDFRQEDLPAYQMLFSHSEFQRLLSDEEKAPENPERLLDMFMAWKMEQPRIHFQLAIELPPEIVIGSCGLRLISTMDKQADFGCELSPAYWEKGYALEAAHALIRFGFYELGLHRIQAETLSENLAAIKLAKKLGMQVEGELSENKWFRGRWWHTTLLSLLASDYNRSS